MTPASDSVTVTVTVDTDPATAFALFTGETDRWWRRGPKFRVAGKRPGIVRFEPHAGGRLLEEFDSEVVETGRITLWDPPARFTFEWRAGTLVDVRFDAVPTGTRVTVRHSGWAAVPADAPVRHGQQGAAFIRQIGLWWADLLTGYREQNLGTDTTFH